MVTAEQPPIYRLRGVERRRGMSTDAFRLRISELVLCASERVAIVGPSGSGKSTLLDLLSLSLAPHACECFEFQADETRVDVGTLWSPPKPRILCALRRRFIGYVLQTGGLLPFLSAHENITLLTNSHLLPTIATERLIDALSLGKRVLAAKPPQLSIGERQRVAIARALAHSPKLILADEPTASLDPVNADATMRLLCELIDELDMTCILVTHNRTLAENHGFTIARLVTQRSQDGSSFSMLMDMPRAA